MGDTYSMLMDPWRYLGYAYAICAPSLALMSMMNFVGRHDGCMRCLEHQLSSQPLRVSGTLITNAYLTLYGLYIVIESWDFSIMIRRFCREGLFHLLATIFIPGLVCAAVTRGTYAAMQAFDVWNPFIPPLVNFLVMSQIWRRIDWNVRRFIHRVFGYPYPPTHAPSRTDIIYNRPPSPRPTPRPI